MVEIGNDDSHGKSHSLEDVCLKYSNIFTEVDGNRNIARATDS
jgi:hypothetical protein